MQPIHVELKPEKQTEDTKSSEQETNVDGSDSFFGDFSESAPTLENEGQKQGGDDPSFFGSFAISASTPSSLPTGDTLFSGFNDAKPAEPKLGSNSDNSSFFGDFTENESTSSVSLFVPAEQPQQQQQQQQQKKTQPFFFDFDNHDGSESSESGSSISIPLGNISRSSSASLSGTQSARHLSALDILSHDDGEGSHQSQPGSGGSALSSVTTSDDMSVKSDQDAEVFVTEGVQDESGAATTATAITVTVDEGKNGKEKEKEKEKAEAEKEEEDLSPVLTKLINEERFEEAIVCKKYIEATVEMPKKEKLYKELKKDMLEEAIKVRKEIAEYHNLNVTQDTISAWKAAPPKTHKTILELLVANKASDAKVEDVTRDGQRTHDTLVAVAQTDLQQALALYNNTKFILIGIQETEYSEAKLTKVSDKKRKIPEPQQQQHQHTLSASASGPISFRSTNTLKRTTTQLNSRAKRGATTTLGATPAVQEGSGNKAWDAILKGAATELTRATAVLTSLALLPRKARGLGVRDPKFGVYVRGLAEIRTTTLRVGRSAASKGIPVQMFVSCTQLWDVVCDLLEETGVHIEVWPAYLKKGAMLNMFEEEKEEETKINSEGKDPHMCSICGSSVSGRETHVCCEKLMNKYTNK